MKIIKCREYCKENCDLCPRREIKRNLNRNYNLEQYEIYGYHPSIIPNNILTFINSPKPILIEESEFNIFNWPVILFTHWNELIINSYFAFFDFNKEDIR
jgi:hypothetical protein